MLGLPNNEKYCAIDMPFFLLLPPDRLIRLSNGIAKEEEEEKESVTLSSE